MTREKYAADQRALLAERNNPHVVSVYPKGDGVRAKYRAVCVCNWRSGWFSTMPSGERAALKHRYSASQGHSATGGRPE